MDTAITVGTNKEAILAAGQVILDILKSGQREDVIQDALKAFAMICNVNGTTISGNTFQ